LLAFSFITSSKTCERKCNSTFTSWTI